MSKLESYRGCKILTREQDAVSFTPIAVLAPLRIRHVNREAAIAYVDQLCDCPDYYFEPKNKGHE